VENFNLKPIGFFKTNEKYPQELSRQAATAKGNLGMVELKPLFPLRQALDDLETCRKIWLIYLFALLWLTTFFIRGEKKHVAQIENSGKELCYGESVFILKEKIDFKNTAKFKNYSANSLL